jgi:tetratricopeptide (TPR) repeat protein
MIRASLPRLLPLLFIGIILVLVYLGVSDLVVMAADARGTATLNAAELKDRIDELKWILGLIVTVAGLFTLAQGVAVGFAAQSFTKQAEDLLSRLRELETTVQSRFEDMTGEVKKRYPIFFDIEERRAQAYANLNTMLKKYSPLNNADEGFDSRRRFYEGMPLAQRQEILSVERFISYDIAGQNEPPEEFAKQLRRLAQFYWAKFLYEQGRGFGYVGDLERAEYLLDVAKRKIGVQFNLLNDVGNIRLESYKARVDPRIIGQQGLVNLDPARELERAQEAFDDSISAQPKQLRAYYNRAVIEADYRQDFAAATKFLEIGSQQPNWETTPIVGLTCVAYFNLGCCYARMSEKAANSSEFARKCIDALKKAAEIGQVDPKDADREYGMVVRGKADDLPLTEKIKTGDLYSLLTAGSEETRQELVKLRSQLSAKHVKI